MSEVEENIAEEEGHAEEVENTVPDNYEELVNLHVDLELKHQIEAVLFAAPKPLKAIDLLELLRQDVDIDTVEASIKEIMNEEKNGGFKLVYIKGLGYQYQTVGEAAPLMGQLFASQPRPLSRAALETLSIIAYRQPVTRAAIEFIRGVDAGSIVKNLIDRELIKCVGRKEDSPGKPMIFGTTDRFLHVFGFQSMADLPTLQSFQPASETMQAAMSELESIDQPVSIEEIVEGSPAQGEGPDSQELQ